MPMPMRWRSSTSSSRTRAGSATSRSPSRPSRPSPSRPEDDRAMHSPALHDRERQILALWERGVGLGRWQREDALLAADGSAPLALGVRNATLLALRGALFNRAWPLNSRCPVCGCDCEFEVDSLTLAEEL